MATKKKAEEPIEVKAEVVETAPKPASELEIIEAKPGAAVKSNIMAVKAWVDEQLKTYDVPHIENDEDYKQAKRDRTSLRKMGTSVDAERKRVKDLYMAPIVAFETEVRTITDPIKKLDGKMKAAIDSYEDDLKDEKRTRLEEFYCDMAPDIAMPLEGQEKALVPFERIFDEGWLNRSVTEAAAQKVIEDIITNLAESEKSIDALNLEHMSEAKAAFWATLDINAAIGRNRELVEAEERQKALEAERAAREAEQAAIEEEAVEPMPEPVPAPMPEPIEAPVPIPAPMPVQDGATPCVMVISSATVEQMQQIGKFAGSLGVTGRFVRGTLMDAYAKEVAQNAYAYGA